jgi:hypothetical protein
MALQKDDGGYDQRLDRLQEQVEEQGRIIGNQKARLDVVEGSWVSRLLHAPEEKDKTSRRDLLRRAGVAAAAAIGGIAILDQPVLAATGNFMVLGVVNNAGADTILIPTAATAPNALLKGLAATTKVGLQGNGTGFSTQSIGMGILGKGTGGAWAVVGEAAATGYDLAAIGTGALLQASQGSGPPSRTSGFQESVRDVQGVQWLSNGATGWYPTQIGGLNIGFFSAVITTQKSLVSSNGVTWTDMDATNLHLVIVPKFHCQAIVTVNADLFTTVTGVNQDIGVRATSSTAPPGVGLYPTTAGQPEGWKESGAAGGALSPNAAFLQTVLPMRAGLTYNLFVVWKANKPAAGSTIYAGAGPIGSKFSPTRMSVQLITDSHANVGATPVHAPGRPAFRQNRR